MFQSKRSGLSDIFIQAASSQDPALCVNYLPLVPAKLTASRFAEVKEWTSLLSWEANLTDSKH